MADLILCSVPKCSVTLPHADMDAHRAEAHGLGPAEPRPTDRFTRGTHEFLSRGERHDKRTAEMALDDIAHIRTHLDEVERHLRRYVKEGDSAYVMDARVCQRATRLEERVSALRATIEARGQLRGYAGIEGTPNA